MSDNPFEKHTKPALVPTGSLSEIVGLKPEWQKVVDDMRAEGYAVIVWTPHELNGADPSTIEDRSVSFGWDVIGFYEEGEK